MGIIKSIISAFKEGLNGEEPIQSKQPSPPMAITAESFIPDLRKLYVDSKDGKVFWYDQIKTLKGEPAKRLKAAIKQIPLPAAFREGAIAYRSLIRQRRKDKEPYEELLQGFYILLTQESFLLSTPYIEDLRIPGYNVACSIPSKVLHSLPMPYKTLGYKNINANKTDIKWFVESWGEPISHINPQQFHSHVWNEALNKYPRIK